MSIKLIKILINFRPKYALSAIKRKILNGDPHVSIYALQVIFKFCLRIILNFILNLSFFLLHSSYLMPVSVIVV